MANDEPFCRATVRFCSVSRGMLHVLQHPLSHSLEVRTLFYHFGLKTQGCHLKLLPQLKLGADPHLDSFRDILIDLLFDLIDLVLHALACLLDLLFLCGNCIARLRFARGKLHFEMIQSADGVGVDPHEAVFPTLIVKNEFIFYPTSPRLEGVS